MKRLICLLLLAGMLVSILVGCGGKTKPSVQSGDGTTETESTTDTPPELTEQEKYHPKKEDLDGYNFRMLLDAGLDKDWCFTFREDELIRDELDDAFYARNAYLEDYYNITISVAALPGNDQYQMAQYLTTMSNGGTDFTDTIHAVAQHIMPNAIPAGHVLDLNQSSMVNFDASYWDQRIQQEYAVNGKLYTLEGDYNIYDELCTFAVFYNSYLWNLYEYADKYGALYDLVSNHKWTLDLMLEMIRDTSRDNDHDNQLGTADRWGMISEVPIPYILYLGSGGSIFSHGEDGSLSILFSDSANYRKAYNIFEDTLKRVSMNEEVLLIDAPVSVGGLGKDFGTAFGMWMNDQALFYTPTVLTVTYLQDMKHEMGILPIPLYTADQESYYSWTSAQSHLPLMVPRTALSHFDTTMKIAEALCYFSKYSDNGSSTVLEQEYGWFTTRKLSHNAKDRLILEMIFTERTYDLDFAMQISGISANVTYEFSSNRKVSGLSGTLASLRGTADAKLAKFLKDLKENAAN